MVQNLPQSMSPTSCRVLLASQSPRRRQLLGMIVPSFEVVNIDDFEPSIIKINNNYCLATFSVSVDFDDFLFSILFAYSQSLCSDINT